MDHYIDPRNRCGFFGGSPYGSSRTSFQTLDLKTDQGQMVFRQLLARADVLVQNLKPGSLDKMGLDRNTLQDQFPSLIVCNISGTVPMARMPGERRMTS